MTRLWHCLSRRRQNVAVYPLRTTRPAGCWSPMRSPRPQPRAEMSRTAPAPMTARHRPLVQHWASPLFRSNRGRLFLLADGLCGCPVAKARQCPADSVLRGAASPAVPAECLSCPSKGSPMNPDLTLRTLALKKPSSNHCVSSLGRTCPF